MCVRQFAALKNHLDFGQIAVFVFLGRFDVDVGCRDATLLDALDFELDRQAERGDAAADRLGVHAGVEQGSQGHVAADAAETVEVGHAHGSGLHSLDFTARATACSAARSACMVNPMTSETRMRRPGTHRLHLPWGGYDRQYLLHVPPHLDRSAALPVVLMFHGAGATARWTVEETGWVQKADREGFLAVFPEGVPAFPGDPPSFRRNPQLWNDGSGRGRIGELNVDDPGFVRALLDQLEVAYAVDAARIFATGFSNGGGLVFRLGVEMSDRLAAIAPVATHCWVKAPRPRRPIPTFYLVGTDDPLAPLDGGEVLTPFSGPRWMPTVTDTWRVWAAAIGSSSEPTEICEEDGVRIVRHRADPAGAELRICTITGLGHHWPGGKGMLNPRLAGPLSNRLNATDVIWNFFREHPM